MSGKFISFEGPEGSGKTTQARLAVKRLEQAGIPVLYTREPGGTPTGESIRAILQYDASGGSVCPRTEVLLFAASRAQLVRDVIEPNLNQGTWIVCDRYIDSTTAYQGYGRGFPVEQILALNEFAIAGRLPDLTLLLNLKVEAGFSRLHERQARNQEQADRMEREDIAFHQRVHDGYLDLARHWPERFEIIDATHDQETVAADVWEKIQHVHRTTLG